MIGVLFRRISRLFSFLRPGVRGPLSILDASFCPRPLPAELLAVSADQTTLLISREPVRLVDRQKDAASASVPEAAAAGYAFPIATYSEACAGLRNTGAEEWVQVVEADRALSVDVLGKLTGLALPRPNVAQIVLHTRVRQQ